MIKHNSLFHKLKSVVGYSLAAIVIVCALSVSGLRFVLTTADLYHDEVEALASKLLEQPVKIGRMDAKLAGLIPTLIFHDVQLANNSKDSLFSLSRLDIGISFKELLLRQAIIPVQLTVRGMELNITRTKEGGVELENISLNDLASEGDVVDEDTLLERWLLLQSEVAIEDSVIIWKDEKNNDLTWTFKNVSLLLRNSSSRHQLSVKGRLPKIVGGDVKLDIDIEGDLGKPSSWNTKLYIESDNINLNALKIYTKNNFFKLNKGIASAKLWSDWQAGKVTQLGGDVKLKDINYNFQDRSKVGISEVSAFFDAYKNKDDIWKVGVDKFNYKNNKKIWAESSFSLSIESKENKLEKLYVQADYFKLGVLAQIISDNSLLKRDHHNILNRLNIRGVVKDLNIVWSKDKNKKIKAAFDQLSIKPWGNIPKIKNLSGTVFFDGDKGRVLISANDTSIGFPKLFRNDFNLSKLSSDILISKGNDGVFFNIPYFKTESVGLHSNSSATIWIPKNKKSPYLDLQTHLSKGDVSTIPDYLPVSIMDKDLVTWLDNAFPSGEVDDGAILFNGQLRDFPFNKKEGVFVVALNANDTTMHYQKGWPNITKATVKSYFTGQGMQLDFAQAKMSNNILYASSAKIASFSDAELELKINANGSSHDFTQFMVNSPILNKGKAAVKSMRLLGSVATNIKINIPLSLKQKKNKSIRYNGSSVLHDSSLYMLDDNIDITKLNGTLLFNEKKITSENLKAKLFGRDINLTIENDVTKNNGMTVFVEGSLKPSTLLTRFEIPGASKISGITPFSGNIFFPSSGVGVVEHYPVITLNSELVGVESALPELLSKDKAQKQKFKFNAVLMGGDKTQFGFEFGNKGSAVVEIDKNRKGVFYLNKGAVSVSSNKAVLPYRDALYIDGAIEHFTPAKWFTALGLNKSKKSQTFFINPIVLNLNKLKLHTIDETKNDKEEIAVNPVSLPKIEGILKQFFFNDIFIGRLDFKTSTKRQGMSFDEIILSSRNMKLVANGEWHYSKGKHRTNLEVTLSSDNFGGMLTDLTFSPTIAGGKASTIGKLHWFGAPSQFSLNKLNGVVQMDLKNGNIIDVDAGAGRLLGFFSLAALPRKLFGDFKDSMNRGFSFDEAKGEIVIENGHAFTNGLEVKSPIADVSVYGRTDLVAREYDNTVEVVPYVGDGVTGLVALLVNLPAGVGLWLVDKMTGEQFDTASTRIYNVTGSWENPEMEQIVEDDPT